jgi:transmembrane sensor
MPEPLMAETETPQRSAARWALRAAEGLTPQEEHALSQWLEANPEHARMFEDYASTWQRFEPLAAEAAALPGSDTNEAFRATNPAPDQRRFWRYAAPALAAAAGVAIALWWQQPGPSAAAPGTRAAVAQLPAPCRQMTLPDGTVVDLNRGAELTVEFTDRERRVRLTKGEASFAVTKNPQRPFVVAAGSVEAWAVGTAFNVRLNPSTAEVLVTEGLVRVQSAAAPAALPVMLSPNQQVVVAGGKDPRADQVVVLTADQMDHRLAWKSRLLEFDDAPLGRIVAAFNRHNPVKIRVDDPTLAAQRMTATFRSDNVESFVHLLEDNCGVRVKVEANGEIHLSRR